MQDQRAHTMAKRSKEGNEIDDELNEAVRHV
jgi:hypothetical protein